MSHWNSQLAIGIVVLTKQDLFKDHRNYILLHHLYNIITQKANISADPNATLIRVMGVQHCSYKHLSLLKNQSVNENDIEKHINLVKCYELFARDNLNHSIDKVRHMFKNIFEKVIDLYDILKGVEQLKNLINWSLDTGWENKTKSIALTCLCKGNQAPLLMNICPELPEKVISLLKDPTIGKINIVYFY